MGSSVTQQCGQSGSHGARLSVHRTGQHRPNHAGPDICSSVELHGRTVQRPCGKCRACSLIAADRHPDVRVLEPEATDRGTQSLKIEQIRGLQQDLSLSAYEGRYKIAIIRDFDAALPSAANAFLKTLEEPPAKVVLLLTATDADELLPTIASRCHTINLRPIPATLNRGNAHDPPPCGR